MKATVTIAACLLAMCMAEASALTMPYIPDPPPNIYVKVLDKPDVVVVRVDDKPEDSGSKDMWEPYVERDAMFVGGATLLGLVVFGTSLRLLIKRNPTQSYGMVASGMLTGGVVFAAISSWVLMYVACCSGGTRVEFEPFMFLLLVSAVSVLLGHGRIIDEINRWRAARRGSI